MKSNRRTFIQLSASAVGTTMGAFFASVSSEPADAMPQDIPDTNFTPLPGVRKGDMLYRMLEKKGNYNG
jgi:hypothetical protein